MPCWTNKRKSNDKSCFFLLLQISLKLLIRPGGLGIGVDRRQIKEAHWGTALKVTQGKTTGKKTPATGTTMKLRVLFNVSMTSCSWPLSYNNLCTTCTPPPNASLVIRSPELSRVTRLKVRCQRIEQRHLKRSSLPGQRRWCVRSGS